MSSSFADLTVLSETCLSPALDVCHGEAIRPHLQEATEAIVWIRDACNPLGKGGDTWKLGPEGIEINVFSFFKVRLTAQHSTVHILGNHKLFVEGSSRYIIRCGVMMPKLMIIGDWVGSSLEFQVAEKVPCRWCSWTRPRRLVGPVLFFFFLERSGAWKSIAGRSHSTRRVRKHDWAPYLCVLVRGGAQTCQLDKG